MSRPPRHIPVERGAPRDGRDPRNPWAPSSFARLARTHVGSVAGDALFAIGLAGSVFFSLDFDSARWRVALYLLLTIAPFAVAAPFIGPALDRIKGGRRWIIVASMVLRAVLAFVVARHLDSLLFYPEAFGMLVLGKVYTISKSAVVPGTVRTDEELVEANSKLTVLSALVVVVAAAPGGLLLWLGDAQWTLALSGICFGAGTVMAFKLPPTIVAQEPPGEVEKAELRGAGIVLAGTAMASIRWVVGFLAFMLAFAFKDEGGSLWQLGVVAVTAQVGFFVGAVVAPRIRRHAPEERILTVALALTAAGGLFTALVGGLFGAALLALLVGAVGSTSKQAFDAILQRDAPDANRGRSFARFETRFQLVWVLGALVPIVVPLPSRAGFLVISVVMATAAVWYLLGQRRVRAGQIPVRHNVITVRRILARRRVRRTRRSGTGPAADSATADATSSETGSEDGAGVAAVRSTASTRPVRPEDPTELDVTLHGPARRDVSVVESATIVAAPDGGDTAPPSADPARRWMRRDDEASPTLPGTAPADPATDRREQRSGDQPEAVDEGQGLLFGPEAWSDLPRPDEAASPEPPADP